MLYKCGEDGCRGHTTFSETCSSKSVAANDYPVLHEFINVQDGGDDDQDTEPVSPVNKDPKGPGLVGVSLHKDGKGKTKDIKEKLAKIQNKQ